LNFIVVGYGTVKNNSGYGGDVNWSPAGGGGRSAIQFTLGVDAIVAGGGGGGGAGNTAYWSPASTGSVGNIYLYINCCSCSITWGP